MSGNASIAEKIKYKDLCRILEKIHKAPEVHSKEKALRVYIDSFKEFSKRYREEHGDDCDSSFYCVLRCLLPGVDNARSSYNIREAAMGALYVKMLNISPTGSDAEKLYNKVSVGCKDYAEIVYNVMSARSNKEPSQLSLAEVHKLLDTMAENDKRKTEAELMKFIGITSAMEQKWLIRIILKKMRLGIGEQKILSLYHPHAKDFYVQHSDLHKVCYAVENGEAAGDASGVQLFSHIRPMRCARVKVERLGDILRNGTFYLETKMDGERFNIHMHNDQYKYISRQGKDYTTNYGRSPAEGNLTPLISKLFTCNVQSIILDGEMMVWKKSASSFLSKGEKVDVKHLHAGGNLQPCFVAYDLLYMNGKSYLGTAYVERSALLRKSLKEQRGVLSFCEATKVQSVNHFTSLFNEAIANEQEGVVLKAHASLYQPGSQNGGWYKVKPDYIEGIISDMDLLILGANYNKSKTYIENFVVGVRTNIVNEAGMPTFYSVGNVRQGLSVTEKGSLVTKLQPHWQSSPSADFMEWGSAIPSVWINPKESVVLQVRASELAPKSSFGTPYELRFPRVERVRDDKNWSDCMTLEEYEDFYKGNCGVKKLTKRGLSTEDLLWPKKTKTESRKKNTESPYSSSLWAHEVKKVTDLLEGISICILSTVKGSPYSMEDLKKIVIKHGGKVVENPLLDSKNSFCVAGDITKKVEMIRDTGLYNIVSADWLLRGFKNDEVCADLVRPKPRDMTSTTPDMREEFDKLYDCFSDSYMDQIDLTEAKIILDSMDSKSMQPLLNSELSSIEQQLFANDYNPNFFRTQCGYFYSPSCNKSRLVSLAELLFRSRGGRTVDFSQPEQKDMLSFVFADLLSSELVEFRQWLQINCGNILDKIRLVSCDWIFECDKKKKCLDMREFLIKF